MPEIFTTLLGFLKKGWDIVVFFAIGLLVMPAMLVMTIWHPTWETWIKEIGSIKDSWPRLILLIPLSIIVMIAMLIMQLLHKTFEDKIAATFGKKPF